MQAAIELRQNNISDVELARRITARDQDACVLLMRRHNQLLFRTARGILRDDAEAEDALQDAYLAGVRFGISSPRATAGRATKASSTRSTCGKSAMPTRSPAP
jgi:hypothetical protein